MFIVLVCIKVLFVISVTRLRRLKIILFLAFFSSDYVIKRIRCNDRRPHKKARYSVEIKIYKKNSPEVSILVYVLCYDYFLRLFSRHFVWIPDHESYSVFLVFAHMGYLVRLSIYRYRLLRCHYTKSYLQLCIFFMK